MSRKLEVEEIAKHNTSSDCWIIIDGKVYDVTRFLNDHPGGDAVILESAGIDGTQPFEDIGHSQDARKQMEEMLVGEVNETPEQAAKRKSSGKRSSSGSNNSSSSAPPLVFALALVVVGVGLYLQNSGFFH